MQRRLKWIAIGLVVVVLLLGAGVFLAGRYFEPYIKTQAIEYLKKRFDSEVELKSLRVQAPGFDMLRLLLRGNVALIDVEGEGLSMRHKGRRDVPPLFALRRFSATVDLKTLFTGAKQVPLVTLDGMEITLPPKGERPDFKSEPQEDKSAEDTGVVIGQVIVREAKLTILPRDKSRIPLQFGLHDIRLESAGKDVAMKYEAFLTNPKPKGQIHSTGTFGPWAAGEPSETPLSGGLLIRERGLKCLQRHRRDFEVHRTFRRPTGGHRGERRGLGSRFPLEDGGESRAADNDV
ncbi:MAG: hypothetical protein WDO18_00280 [Acidobacteriota bacterium]